MLVNEIHKYLFGLVEGHLWLMTGAPYLHSPAGEVKAERKRSPDQFTRRLAYPEVVVNPEGAAFTNQCEMQSSILAETKQPGALNLDTGNDKDEEGQKQLSAGASNEV